MLLLLASSCLLALGVGLPRARAFSEPKLYGDLPAEGGGGGRYFTGSPADGYGCGSCHTGQGSFPIAITGLPVDGYVPGKPYVVRVSWPLAAQRALSATAQGFRPSTTLTAEFVAESGTSFGSIDLQRQFAGPTEVCADMPVPMAPAEVPTVDPLVPGEPPAATPPPANRLAATVFKNDPDNLDAAPVEVTECDGSAHGQRCVVATRACGSSEVRIEWTAPEKWRGPIWFSVGFVTTDDASGVPNDYDFVTEVSVPINAAAEGPQYEMTFESGCSVSRATGSRVGAGAVPFALLLLGLGWRSRRRLAATRSKSRRDAALWLALVAGLAGTACGDDELTYVGDQENSNIGLFTPGFGQSVADAALGEFKCPGKDFKVDSASSALDDDAGTNTKNLGGKLSINFTTTARPGHYDKNGNRDNYGVVWIEDLLGAHVTTLETWGVKYMIQGINEYYYQKRRLGCDNSPPDAITRATLLTHEAHSLEWDGTTVAKDVVPDGMYNLYIEVQVDEKPKLAAVAIPFMKGRSAYTIPVPPSGIQESMTLNYTPSN
ncbi:MAG TPA: DUF2271 domain-containing protein [Polyangiaceae bacterium]|nr:DUF2271 domain-containing protein [Polyangiaceae bacterium]